MISNGKCKNNCICLQNGCLSGRNFTFCSKCIWI